MSQTLQQIRVLWGEILRVSAVHQDLAFRGSVDLEKQKPMVEHCDAVFGFCVGNKKGRTWFLSPSYLNSQVKLFPSKRSKMLAMLFVGWASMGFSGMPGVMEHVCGSFSMPSWISAGIIFS